MLEADKIGLKPGARLLPTARQYTTAAGVYESGDKLREYVHQTSKAVCSVCVACAASDAARARWLILIYLTRRVGRSSIAVPQCCASVCAQESSAIYIARH